MPIYAERLGEHIRITIEGIASRAPREELLSRREALRLVRELLDALDVTTTSGTTDLRMSPSIQAETPPTAPSS